MAKIEFDAILDKEKSNRFKSVNFRTGLGQDSSEAGEVHWNDDYYTINIPTGLGPSNQAGQELYTIIYNDTGFEIPNGAAVRLTGTAGGYASVSLAKADIHETVEGSILIATMTIPNGEVGVATRFGRVQGIDTTLYGTPGPLYISETTAGELTTTKPEFPDYPIAVGAIEVFAADGVLSIDVAPNQVPNTFDNFWNGVFRESFEFTVDSTGGVVTGSLSPSNGHPDMTMIFSDGLTMLTTTPAATIELTPGTDDNPQENFVYILETTKALTVSTSEWPTVEHIKVSSVVLRSAATTETEKALKVRNWNDHLEDTSTFQGHLTHITERLRQEPAKWSSGTEGIVTIDGSYNVYLGITSGVVYQLHKQTIDALQMPTDEINIVNNFAANYTSTDNLNTQTLDSTGATLANRSFSFVFWATANSSGEQNHLMCNLPTGSYLKNNPASAVEDATNFSVYTIPSIFEGTGYLIGRATFVLEANGTTWSLYDYEDLRGRIPNTTAGGGSSGSGVTTWTALTDTPNSYIDQALNLPQVNAGETALEFTNTPTITNLNITETTDKNYVSDAELVVIGNTSGTNTGDQEILWERADSGFTLRPTNNEAYDKLAIDADIDITGGFGSGPDGDFTFTGTASTAAAQLHAKILFAAIDTGDGSMEIGGFSGAPNGYWDVLNLRAPHLYWYTNVFDNGGILERDDTTNEITGTEVNVSELAKLSGATFTGDISATNLSGTNTGDQVAGDFNHDDLANITGTAGQYNHPTDANMTVLGNTSGTNTGDQDLSSYAPLASPTFTGTVTAPDITLGDAGEILLDAVPASDHTGTGTTASMTVDVNTYGVAAALHMDTDGNWIMADADTTTTMPCEALALETGTGTKKVLLQGFIRNDTWAWTVGGLIYVSTTPGTLTQTAVSGTGDQLQVVGFATHADRMFFNPNLLLVEIP